MIDLLPDSSTNLDPSRTKCLVLTDFNRSIDLKLLPENTSFRTRSTSQLQCPEMKLNKNWTYQIDYFGILNCIRCLLLKKYLNFYDERGICKSSSSITARTYPNLSKMFENYLNIPSCNEIPDLKKFIKAFEDELKELNNSNMIKTNEHIKCLKKNYFK
jgi:checkpoint serine/threonine-protein kinase